MRRFFVSVCAAAALLAALAPVPASGVTYDKLAYLTFSAPVQIPGATLSAGTYRFHLANRIDHRWTAGAGLMRRFGDQFRIGGHIDWARRVSTLPFFSYQGLRYGLTAEVLP